MWNTDRFNENVNRLSDALAPLATPGTVFAVSTVREASARGRHVVEQIRLQVVPYLPDLVAQDSVGMLGRLEALMDQLGNTAATKHDLARAAVAARTHLTDVLLPVIGRALEAIGGTRPGRAVRFAQDVRVCELQFLSAVEQGGELRLSPGKDGFRDTPPDVVRQMTYSLIEDGMLNGPASLADDADPAHTEARRNSDLSAVLRGDPLDLRLNHRGRLRLARLRDELLDFDKRERFGILLDARGLDRVLAAELAITSAGRPLAVICGDVDHFKRINDTYGHPRGDEVLKAVFRIFSEAIDTHGNAFRQGGEEIIGILPVDDVGKAHAIAESVRRRVELEVGPACQLPDPLTISLGVLVLTDGTATPASVVDRGDRLLYEAKQQGRNRVVTEELHSNQLSAPR
jgi:diguanylate cyclase (GGDEF)-like protein